VIRRITGKTLGEFFAQEIAGPLGADYHIGTGPECDHRVCTLIQAMPITPPVGEDRSISERALEMQSDSTDLVCGYPLRWGLGYGLDNPFISQKYDNCFAGRRIAFWGGAGGSTVFNDFDAMMTVAFVMNRHLEHGGIDPRGIDVVRAAYKSLSASR